jgi:uroporphyrinogen decarboxylase
MVPPDVLRKLVFPWYKQIVASAHAKGKYAILHSCGCYTDIIEDIIQDMAFDGRHSYEDKIVCVETAYSELYPRIAVMGGIDVDFLARSSADEVYRRCRSMLTQSASKGGYALGSGNSVPDYIPDENYVAMLKAGNEDF